MPALGASAAGAGAGAGVGDGVDHLLDGVDGDGVRVQQHGLDPRDGVEGARLDGDDVALVLQREVVVPGGVVGGERVHDAVMHLRLPGE